MRNHFNKYKLIKGSQPGFTKGSSCLTNPFEFYEAVSDWLDEGVDASFSKISIMGLRVIKK